MFGENVLNNKISLAKKFIFCVKLNILWADWLDECLRQKDQLAN